VEIRLKLLKIISSPLSYVLIALLISTKGNLEIIDTEYSVRTALALIEDGSMLIDVVDQAVLEIAPKIDGTEKIYSQYGLGLVAIFLPIVSVGKLISLVLGIDQRITIDFLLSFYNVPFAILGLYFFRSILVRVGTSEPKANLCMLLLFCCTGFWKYSVTDFSEITQVAFLLGAINSSLLEKGSKWKHVSFWCALLVAMKLVYVILLPIFFAYAIWSENEKINLNKLGYRCLDFCLFLFPMGFFLAYMNNLRFGSIFETGYGSQAASFSFEFFLRDWFDYLFSMQRGIFPFNPILLLSSIGWFFLPKENRKFFLLIGSITLIWFILMCFWKSLQGGYCWGNRLLIPILPLLFMPLAFVPFHSKISQLTIVLITAFSCLIQISSVCTKTHEVSVLRNEIYSQTNLSTPPQLPSTLRLFWYKLTSDSTIVPASAIGVSSDKNYDLSSYKSFYGFNLWPIHALKFIGLNSYCYRGSLAILALLTAIVFLLFKNTLSSCFD
jgi:hypothetical protein